MALTPFNGELDADTLKPFDGTLDPETPAERGLIGETVAGFKRGGLQLLDMGGNIARAVDPEGGVDVVRNAGLGLSRFAKERAQRPDVAESAYIEKHPILGNIPKGAEMVIPSIGVPLAIGAGATAAGVSAPVALGAGAVGAGAFFGASQFQDTKERGIEAGLTPEAASSAGIKTGLIEGGGEALSNVIPFSKIVKLGKPAAGSVLKSVFKAPDMSTAVKRLASDAAQIMGGEVSTEMAQAYTQGVVERDAGIRPDANPFKEAKDVIGPTIALSLLMGGVVGGANKLSKVATEKALQNQNVGEDVRRQAANNVYESLRRGEADGSVPAGSASYWMQNAEEAIVSKSPLVLSDDLLRAPVKPATDEDLMATATEALTRAASGESLSDAIEELNAAKVEEKLAQDDALAQALSLGEAPASQELPTPLPTPIENIDPPPQVDPSTGELLEENPVIDWLNSLPFKERNKLIKKATDSPIEAQEYLRRKYEEAVNPTQSEVIPNGEKGRRQEVLDQQGAAVTAPTFTKKSPVPPPNNPAFLTPVDVKEAVDGSFEVTQPKAEPVTDKDVPAMLDAISEAYDNGHAMEDYAPENFGKVDGKVKIIDADSMTPLDSPDVVHGSKEELMAAAQAKLSPQVSSRSKVGIEEQFNKEFTAKYLQGGIEASRAEDMVDDYAADPAVQQTLDMDEEEAIDYFNSLAEGIKSRSKQAAKSRVKLSTKGQKNVTDGSRMVEGTQSSRVAQKDRTTQADAGGLYAGVEPMPADAVVGAGDRWPSAATVTQGAVRDEQTGTAGQKATAKNAQARNADPNKPLTPGAFTEVITRNFGAEAAGDIKLVANSGDFKLADAMAKEFGKRVYSVNMKGTFADVEGMYDPSRPDDIFISKSVRNPVITIVGHEAIHGLKKNAPALYKKLKDFIWSNSTKAERDAYIAKLSTWSKRYAGEGIDALEEEYVANLAGNRFGKTSFWNALAKYNATLFSRLFSSLKLLLDKAKQVALLPMFREAANTQKDLKALDNVLARVFSDYSELYREGKFDVDIKMKFSASEKGVQNEKDKFTASILAGASGEARGSNLGAASDELGRVVPDGFYDTTKFSPRARKTKEAQVLRSWANKNGLIRDHVAFDETWNAQAKDEVPIRGNEHDVIFNGDGTVTKRNHLPGTYHVSYKELFDRVALFNYLFGGDATLTLTGFQDTPDGLLPEFTQKYLKGTPARIEQTEKMLSDAGFEPVGNKTTAYRLPGTDIIITDVFGENTRQVGDVTVPMDYVIFHGERARSWLKAQEKVELPEFDEAEFDKGFDAAMKFSATELAEGKNLAKNVTEWFKSFPYLRVLEDATNTAYRWLMPVDRVVNLAASQKDYTPIKNLLLRYISQKAEKSGYTSSAMNDAHHVNQRIDKAFKTEADQKNLQDLVWKATTYELHADPNRHNDWTAKSWEEAGMLEATGKSLGAALKEVRDAYAKLSPEQKSAHAEMLDLVNQMYHDGRKAELAPFELAYGKELVAKADAYKGSVEAAPADIKDVLPLVRQVNDRYPTLKGDYMPLMRFGQYAVRTYAVDENGEMGERTRTEFFENAEDALVYVREINEGSSGLQAKLETRPDIRRDVVNIPGSFLDKLRIAAEKRGFTGEALDSLMQDAEGLRANILPRTSVVGNKLRREGVEGYNQNVTRVFAAYVRNHASANARLIHGSKIEQTFRDIGNEIDAYSSNRSHDPNAAKNMHLLKDQLYELERSGNNEKINKFTKAVGKMTFVWYLASPSVWAVQWSQPFMTTIPKMAARFGFGTSFGAYTSAAKEYMQGKYSDEKIDEFDRTHEYVGLRVANLLAEGRESDAARKREIDQEIKGLYDSFNVSDRKLLVLKVLAHQGMIDLSSAHSLQDLIAGATDGDKLVNKAIEKAAFFMQKSETGSRRAAAVSAFELAFKDGKGFTAANDYTTDIIRDTLADFSSQNRAAWMRGNAGRILGQFQFFRLHMVGKLIQLSKDAIGGEYQRMIDDANGDQAIIDEAKKKRSEARKELAYMIGSSFALAGAGGTPVALALSNTATSALWSALAFMFGDDDDPWDPKRDFEVMVRESMGDVAGGVVLKGLPSLVGADISRRIGMGGMANIISGDPPAGLTGTAKANWYAGRILGPAWGVASDGLRTLDAIKEGDLSTALSAGSPKVIKDFVKTLGVSDKGIQAGGKTILQADDVSPYSIALMLSGINPMDVSLAQEESRYIKNLSTEMSQRRSKLIRDVAKATVDGEDTGDALAAVSKWTATHPKLGITAQELASGIKKERKSRLGLLTERERLVKEGA